MTKGFITLATGDYYCWLAEHLYMSYKLYGNCDYPFYVITDKVGSERLSKTFDGVILRESFTNTSVDKMCIFTDTPFDETVFIDSDCSVVNDINYVFELFENNGSDISAIAGVSELISGMKGIQFGTKAIDAFEITNDFPNFNGGLYYYKKSAKGLECVDFMMNHLLPHYHDYELMGRSNSTNMGDEPIVIVGMLKYGFKPLPVNSNIMVLVHDANTVKWDIKNRKCVFPWYEYIASPTIIHWKVGGTETYTYERYNEIVRCAYYEKGMIYCRFHILLAYAKYNIYPHLLKIFPNLGKWIRKKKKCS